MWDNVRMNEMIQQECKACDQVLTLLDASHSDEYCFPCAVEINEWHDANTITDDEIDAWADLWKLHEQE